MANQEDGAGNEPEKVRAAAAGAGTESAWARHGRTEIQASHTLTEPLARWAPEPVERLMEVPAGAAAASEPDFVIPAAVLQARPAQRLPEDAICRSPIAGLVVAVMASAGQCIAVHDPVLVIEAMKMQNQVTAQVGGVVKAIHVLPGDAVKPGQVLFELV